MFRLWLTPVWQDRTIVGRLMSIIFRTFRVIVGGVLLIVSISAMLLLLTMWFVMPFVLLTVKPLIVLLIILGLWLFDWVVQTGAMVSGKTEALKRSLRRNFKEFRQELFKLTDVKTLLWVMEKEDITQGTGRSSAEELVHLADTERQKTQDKSLRVEHFLLAYLSLVKFHYTEAVKAYNWLKAKRAWVHRPWLWEDDYPIRPIGGINRGWTGITTPLLNKLSIDLTQMAAHGTFSDIVGHQKEIEEIVRILGRKGRENVLIVGEAGSGKTALVQGLANQIIEGTQYSGLRFKRLVELDIAALTSGSAQDIRARLKTIVDELRSSGNVILCIDEIHNLVSAKTEEGQAIVFATLEPHLDAGEFQFIATTTPENYKRYIEPQSAFTRTFRVITLPTAYPLEAEAVLERKAFEFEEKHHVAITYPAIETAVELARRYIHDRVLPDSAIDLLEESVNKAAQGDKTVTAKDVENMATEKTRVPVRMADSPAERNILLNLEKLLHERVIGQEAAIDSLGAAMRRARTGMTEEGRLLASFLFAGATGVGKTETAKALATVYFGSEKSMIRLDMSEYQTPESINRLLGPPPGQPGFELGGQLTEAMRRHPFTLILLDEIEKADPHVLNVFLQLLDDARLTDSAGRVIDFANTIVIATTNVGTQALIKEEKAGKKWEEISRDVLSEIHEKFRPEFLNRFTDIVVFHPLSPSEVLAITQLLLNTVKKKLAEKELQVEFSDELVKLLAQKGFDQQWGAREIRRVIFHEVEEKIAKKILEGAIQPGKTVTLSKELMEL